MKRNYGISKMKQNRQNQEKEDDKKIVWMSDVCFETNVGRKLTLKELKHVPNSCLNLILALPWASKVMKAH